VSKFAGLLTGELHLQPEDRNRSPCQKELLPQDDFLGLFNSITKLYHKRHCLLTWGKEVHYKRCSGCISV
jgi:hypothetical protein